MSDNTQFAAYNPTFTVREELASGSQADLVFEPLEQGYGHTLGNALRRVLLSSLSGYAITGVRIDGVDHQYTTIEGVSEDVMELILNLKQVRVKGTTGQQTGVMRLDASGPTEVTAANIQPESGFEVINGELHLATLAKGKKLSIELTVEQGTGYALATDRKETSVGQIMVDALFSPVIKVSYTVESTRVGRRTDFDKLVMSVTTDGSLSPLEAAKQAAQILARQFTQVFDPVVADTAAPVETVVSGANDVMKLTVEELDLPTRIANALRKGGFKTVADLVGVPKPIVAKVKNLGEKSVSVVNDALLKKGVSLGE